MSTNLNENYWFASVSSVNINSVDNDTKNFIQESPAKVILNSLDEILSYINNLSEELFKFETLPHSLGGFDLDDNANVINLSAKKYIQPTLWYVDSDEPF
jgi:hypothetical protein